MTAPRPADRTRSTRPSRSIRALAVVPLACVTLASLVLAASAKTASADDATDGTFAAATQAMREGRAGDAIASFESLADEGVVDAVASYDRGLAYAMRVRIGAEVPGDLGRAAHGFEEARDLAGDPALAEDAAKALGVVRGEIARRRVRAGEPVELDPGRSLSRTLASLLPESRWSWMAVVFSVLLAFGLAARTWDRRSRARIGGGVTASIAAPALALAVAMTLAARHDRLTLREAVVVVQGARPSDARGVALPGATPIPEGARVEIIDAHAGSTRVRFGATDAWVTSGTLREIARL